MNVVFDFGAVLFTWRPADLLRLHLPEQADTPERSQALASAIFHHADWLDFDRGVVELEQVIERTSARLQLPRSGLDALMGVIGERLTPMTDTVALLHDLVQRRDRHGDVRLFFLSNMPEPYSRVLEQRHDFLRWFDGGVFSGDVQLIKPDPAIFELLAQRHDLQPQRTVFIDDLQSNVQAARGLGWHGIHFQSAQQLADELALHLPARMPASS